MTYKPLVLAFTALCAIIASISAGNACNCGIVPPDLAAQISSAKYKYKGKVNSKAEFQGSNLYFIQVDDCCGETPCPESVMVKSGGRCAIDDLELYKTYTFLLNDDNEMDGCTNSFLNVDFSEVKQLCNGGNPEDCPSKTFVQDEVCGLCQKLKDADCDDDEPTCVCTKEYAPVCALAKDGEKKTFGNACMAGCDNARVLYQGECKDEDCCCSDKIEKVCGQTCKGETKTFDNQCKARCNGATIVSQGACPDDQSCICPAVIQKVCALTTSGDKKTFNNSCKATCDNAVVLYNGECQSTPAPGTCGCNNEDKKVCGVKSGQLKTFQNLCLAECEEYRPLYNGECFN
uniref:Kazal-like domain-containing protein n=1 Tax=Percolomonas cosmopolitus TaxID=63605 RepID=A0A7S1KRV5_9EUKA|eukprot:CAMPEP_0117438808 /NCGR_PEP_ID=MMETSP0759-20121206/2245_1 /TAXON_ID=63605 /ORGANISM="Percolomonas cosmopolitus, Strain WS" /LENGTH=345 /DNA_ID=CAMNT_0005230513 /DNA_START=44 /DNA_END=1081 /DNA_ORIENTATION=+